MPIIIAKSLLRPIASLCHEIGGQTPPSHEWLLSSEEHRCHSKRNHLGASSIYSLWHLISLSKQANKILPSDCKNKKQSFHSDGTLTQRSCSGVRVLSLYTQDDTYDFSIHSVLPDHFLQYFRKIHRHGNLQMGVRGEWYHAERKHSLHQAAEASASGGRACTLLLIIYCYEPCDNEFTPWDQRLVHQIAFKQLSLAIMP